MQPKSEIYQKMPMFEQLKDVDILSCERPLEEEVGAKQICKKETSLISQLFKTFTLDLEIVLKN